VSEREGEGPLPPPRHVREELGSLSWRKRRRGKVKGYDGGLGPAEKEEGQMCWAEGREAWATG
jgi:hypothetical protein